MITISTVIIPRRFNVKGKWATEALACDDDKMSVVIEYYIEVASIIQIGVAYANE